MPPALILDPFELRLVTALRAMPDGPLKDRVRAVLDRVVVYMGNPRCPELQADGAPCGDAHGDCDLCPAAKDVLDGIAGDLA